jgi:hypothetical protein
MKINEKYIVRKINDNIILINKYEQNEIYKFYNTSKQLFMLVQETNNQEKIIQKYQSKYKINYEQAKKDVNNFIEELNKLGILE